MARANIRYLYRGHDGRWWVSDHEDMNNGRARGWLKSDRPDYASPQDARWEVFDRRLDATAGVQFFYDSKLQCTVSQVDAPALFKHARNRKTKKARLMKQSVLLEGHTAGYAGLMGVCVARGVRACVCVRVRVRACARACMHARMACVPAAVVVGVVRGVAGWSVRFACGILLLRLQRHAVGWFVFRRTTPTKQSKQKRQTYYEIQCEFQNIISNNQNHHIHIHVHSNNTNQNQNNGAIRYVLHNKKEDVPAQMVFRLLGQPEGRFL